MTAASTASASVTLTSWKVARSPSSAASASPFSRFRSAIDDVGAGAVEAPDGGFAEARGPAADERAG